MSLRRASGGLLCVGVMVFTASDVSAEPEPPTKPAADRPPVVHGSLQGRSDSRGPGDGDGDGRQGPGSSPNTMRRSGPSHGGDAEPDAEPDRGGLGAGDEGADKPASGATGVLGPADDSALAMQLNEDFLLIPSLSYRLRYYHEEGRDFTAGGVSNALRHRARLGVRARYRSLAEVFVQLQDVRTFGEETDPAGDFSADGFDLHQGYLSLSPSENVRLRLGRQEVVLANERLVGRQVFTEHSRSLDGVHLRYDDAAELEAGYFVTRDHSVGAQPDSVGAQPDGLSNGKRHLAFGHLGYAILDAFEPHVLTILEVDTATERFVVTAGGLITGHVGRKIELSYSAEGYYQGGAEGNVSISAWLGALSTRVTTVFDGQPFAEVFAALVSGDTSPDDPTINTFTSPYPRDHRIHGEMDFFSNFLRDTDARGLRDLGAKVGWAPKKVALTTEFHFFDAMATRPDGLRHFGFESDFKVSYAFWDYVSIDALYAFFVPGEIKRVGRIDPGVEHNAYTTARVAF